MEGIPPRQSLESRISEGFGGTCRSTCWMRHQSPSDSEQPPDSAGNAALILSESQIYLDYKKAFTRATGLPLQIRASLAAVRETDSRPEAKSNPFCALMAKSNQSCAACLAMQRKIEEEAKLEARTLKCFAGLCETAVPIRVGNNLIAFLETGQILLSHPDSVKFNRVAETLVRWGTEVDLKQVEEAYFNTRVLSDEQYESMIHLLTTFAEHLSVCGQQLLATARLSEPAPVTMARKWIQENSDGEISLARVARTVNMSAKYFSEVFHEATGITFTDYVSHVRVEKAKRLLQNPNSRISEVAFEVGFQSLSQFNRTFKKLVGHSPKEIRTPRQ